MYLEIDEGFPKHRKTLRLRSIMKDPRAGWYMVDLWTWACRSCPDGDLTGISSYEIEEAANYQACDGKLCKAMIDSGFIDTDADGKPIGLHNWMERTGAAIARMAKRASDMKALRDQRKRERDATVTAQLQNGDATNLTRPVQTSQDQTRQVDSPRARSNPPANEPGKPSPANVVRMFLNLRAQVIGGSTGVSTPFAQPQQSEIERAERWLSTMSPEEAQDIEPAIRLACEHVRDGAEGWTHGSITKTGFLFGAIVTNWRDLCEELHGCAPKPAKPKGKDKPAPTVTPIREW